MDTGILAIIVAFSMLLTLLAFGLYVGVAMGLSGIVGFMVFTGSVSMAPIYMAFQQCVTVTTTYAYMVVPLFLLMGHLASATRIAEDLFNSANKLFGQLPGGLAITATVTNAGLAAVTGSSLSTAVAMTRIALPELRKHKYKDELSLGAITVGGTLALMIPPSITLVLYGIFGEQSIGKLLMAGILPGLLLTVLYILVIIVRVKINPSLAPQSQKYTWKEKLRAIPPILPLLVLILSIIIGILAGLWTPVEASGVACVMVFLLGIFRRRLTFEGFLQSIVESAVGSTSLLLLVLGAMIFGRLIGITGIGELLVKSVISWNLAPIEFFFLLVVFYVFLGMFLEVSAMIAITVPLVVPMVIATGWDPIWFGVVFVNFVEIALVTPPIGLTLFAVKAQVPEVSFHTLYMSCIPFWLCNVFSIFVLYMFPIVALLLPNIMMGK